MTEVPKEQMGWQNNRCVERRIKQYYREKTYFMTKKQKI